MELTEAQNQFLASVVHSKWLADQYTIVYEKTPQRIELLNTVASTFFGTIQLMWIQRMILDICKIMGPPVQGPNRNLTLDYFINSANVILEKSEAEHLKTCRTIYNEAKKARSKVIAHIDLDVAVAANPLQLIGTNRIRVFYKSLQHVINAVHLALVPNTSYSITPLSPPNDAETAILALEQAAHYSQLFDDNPLKAYDEQQRWEYRDA